jgi:hypothetical protein
MAVELAVKVGVTDSVQVDVIVALLARVSVGVGLRVLVALGEGGSVAV